MYRGMTMREIKKLEHTAMIIGFAWALCGALAAGGQQTNMAVLYRFQFGNDYQLVVPGYQPVSRVFRSPRYMWIAKWMTVNGRTIPTRCCGILSLESEASSGWDWTTVITASP